MSSTFTVTNRQALYDAVDPPVADVAGQLAGAAAGGHGTRTGQLGRGWKVTRTRAGEYLVTNDVPYARFVEYGTRHMRAQAPLGRAAAIIRGRYGA